MATYKFYLSNYKSEVETHLVIYLAENNSRLKFYTDLKILPKDWNKKTFEARKTYSGYSDFNSLLSKRRDTLKTLHEKMKCDDTFTSDNLRKSFYEAIGKRESDTNANYKFSHLAEYITYFIETVANSKTPKTISNFKQTLRVLVEFEKVKRRKITFERVNLDFYYDFLDYMTKVKKYSLNTIGKNIKNLKVILNDATERAINTNLDYMSKKFKSPSESVENIYLTENEILEIYEFDFSKNKKLDRTRDLFIIGCNTGLRFSDFSQITAENINGDFLKVTTQKTGEKVVIPLHWTLKEILKKYSETTRGLPPPISNQKMNEYLKEIGQIVGIDEVTLKTTTREGLKVTKKSPKYCLITTHTARRSFATNLYKSGFPSIAIMKITGHRTELSFMKYIKISQEENAKKLIEHWQSTFKLKAV